MPLFARRRPGPVALPAPRLDGTGWPAPGRPSFAASALHELALRGAYEVEAHAVADALVDRFLVRLLPGGVGVEDEPYLRKTVLTAARVGAGLGRTVHGSDLGPDEVDEATSGALLRAREGLPAMPGEQEVVAGWFLLAAFRVARLGPDEVARLEAALETRDGAGP